MGNLKKQERAAVEAVARRFSAKWVDGDASCAAVTIAGKRVGFEVAALKLRGGAGAKPRLRFDKVVIRLVGRLKANLRDAVPDGVTVLVTVTAPIRLAGKTAVALEEKIRALLARKGERPEKKATMHGNRIRIRVENAGSGPASKVIGFVHNPDTDPRIFFDMTRSLLVLFRATSEAGAARGSAGERWLVMRHDGGPLHADAYKHIYSELRLPSHFKKVLLVSGDGRVETLG